MCSAIPTVGRKGSIPENFLRLFFLVLKDHEKCYSVLRGRRKGHNFLLSYVGRKV